MALRIVTLENNPLLIETVIENLLKFLPFEEIKKIRVVCSEWNAAAELALRKRGKIRFLPMFRPSDFMTYTASSRLREVPFTAFKFSSSDFSVWWHVQDLLNLFQKWKTTLKYLELTNVTLTEKGRRVEKLDLNPWIDLLSKSLIELKVTTSTDSSTVGTSFVVSMDKLASIQNISLSNVEIILNSTGSRVNPRKISLHGITFLQNGNKIHKVALNDIIDVSECSEFSFGSCGNSALEFDMSKDAANTEIIEFDDVRVLNWKISKVKTDRLKLEGCPLEQETPIQMKELNCKHSIIDLSLLPKTLEALTLNRCKYAVRNDNDPIIYLPNLKSLKALAKQHVTSHYSKFKQNFSKETYPNVVGVHLQHFSEEFEYLTLEWLPIYMKKLKLRWNHTNINRNRSLVILTDTINVDTVILDLCLFFPTTKDLKRIRPKILVFTRLSCDPQTMNQLFAFIFQNKHLEKIVVEINGMKISKVWEYIISDWVDKRSDYYEFNSQSKIGTAITQCEFELYCNVDY